MELAVWSSCRLAGSVQACRVTRRSKPTTGILINRDPALGTLRNLIEPAIDRAKSGHELTP
jgi:hypothetical protein